MNGPVEQVGKATASFFDTMKQQPLSLALVVMNLCLLGFFYIILTAIAAQRTREVDLLYKDNKEVRDMLAKCVVPPAKSGAILDPISPFRQLATEEPRRPGGVSEEPPRPPKVEEPGRPLNLLPLPNQGWPK